MIDFQRITPAYLAQAIAYCADKQVEYPIHAEVVFIALEDNKVIGVVGVKKVFQIEPLAAESGLTAQILGEKAMAVISLAEKPNMMVLSKNEDFIQQLERYGFVITDKGMTVLKKDV